MATAPPASECAGAPMRWCVWVLASAGKFFEGLVVFLGGFTLPLVVEQFQLSPLQQGGLSASSLIGILVGAVGLGGLADRLGRRPLFIAAMALLLLGLALVVLSPDPLWLAAGLLLIGLALGADYPIAHLVIAECVPVARRGRMVLSAFGFQALGILLATALAALLWPQGPEPASWRLLYLLPLPAVLLVLFGRLLLPRHSSWLLGGAELQAARQAMIQRSGAAITGWRLLLQPPLRRATALACLPWFLQDLATYGVGLSLPLLLAAAGATPRPAARAALWIELMLVLGIAAAIALADRWGRIPLQISGFLGCAAGLLLAGFALGSATPSLPLLAAGLALFQFMTNLGPNAQTYLLAGELFPPPLRGLGAGSAAAAGKAGAVITALVFPLVPQQGAGLLLLSLALTSLLGAAITWCFRQETRDRDLLAELWPELPTEPVPELPLEPSTDPLPVSSTPQPGAEAPSSAAPL